MIRRVTIQAFAAIFLAAGVPGTGLTGVAAAQWFGPYMVFFDRGSTELSPQGRAILDNAISTYMDLPEGQQVLITGHTDRAVNGEAAFAESQMRARSVRDYLVSKGIPLDEINTEAFGNTRPLVETAAGVADLQNRRVEISFGPDSRW